MEFVFHISPYSDPSLVQQVSRALKERTELCSRTQFPKLWRVTDNLNRRHGEKTVSNGRRMRYRIYGILLIVMGVILFVPGIMDPKQLLVPLAAGVVGILAGGFTLWAVSGSQAQSKRFDQAAKKLLKGFEAPPAAQVRFTPEGMEIAGKPAAAYPDVDFAAETENLFLLTWNEKVTILQKKDLVGGDCPQFAAFLCKQMQEHGTFCRLS